MNDFFNNCLISLDDQLETLFFYDLRNQLWRQLEDQPYWQLKVQLGDQLRDQLKQEVSDGE